MMNIPMMEDKLDGSSKFKVPEDKNLEEDLLWVIQKGDTMTTLFMKMSRGQRSSWCYSRNHISTLMYALVYIICIIFMRGIAGGRNLLAKVMDSEGSRCIQKNNTLEVKTPGLIVEIVIPLTYISKFCYITSICCSYDNNP
jgi:hypothetical protein